MTGDIAVSRRLAGLTLEAAKLLFEHGQGVVEAPHVGFGAPQPELGLVAARVKAGDPGRLLQQRAPGRRLGGDHGADLALFNHRRRVGAARRIGEQQLDVLGPYLAPVDAIARSGAALDTADDDQLVGVVERRRGTPIAVVGGERDLGQVAGRTGRGAAEDHVVHLAAAHLLGRSLAHDPAHGFDKVRFAAAVGAHDPGHAGLDEKLRRLDEGLEARDTNAREVHGRLSAEAVAGRNPGSRSTTVRRAFRR